MGFNQATLRWLVEHREGVQFTSNLAKLYSCIGGAERSGGFQEKDFFTSVGQSLEEMSAPLMVGAGLL